jgi:hypothetical protein
LPQKNVINLAQVRKSRARAEKAAAGTENAVKFGRTKAQRAVEREAKAKAEAHLDGHKSAPGPDTPKA